MSESELLVEYEIVEGNELVLRKEKKSLNPYYHEGTQDKDVTRITKKLVQMDAFKLIKICPDLNVCYVYYPLKGYWKQVTPNYIKRMVWKSTEVYRSSRNHQFVTNVYNTLELTNGVLPEEVQRDPRYICFLDGVYDLVYDKLLPHTPEIFVTSNLDFHFSSECEIFSHLI